MLRGNSHSGNHTLFSEGVAHRSENDCRVLMGTLNSLFEQVRKNHRLNPYTGVD